MKHISLKEITIDFTIIISSIILSHYSVINKIIFHSKYGVLITLLVLEYYIPIYISKIYNNSYRKSSNKILKNIGFIIFIQILLVTLFLLPIPFKSIINNKDDSIVRLFEIGTIGWGVLISMFGIDIWGDNLEKNEEVIEEVEKEKINPLDDLDSHGILLLFTSFIWLAGGVFFFYYFSLWIAIILTFITIFFIPMNIYLIGTITSSKSYSLYIESILIGIAYSIWINFIFFRFIDITSSFSYKIFILIIMGVFSVRLFILFEPPFKKGIIVTSIISITFFLYNLGLFQ